MYPAITFLHPADPRYDDRGAEHIDAEIVGTLEDQLDWIVDEAAGEIEAGDNVERFLAQAGYPAGYPLRDALRREAGRLRKVTPDNRLATTLYDIAAHEAGLAVDPWGEYYRPAEPEEDWDEY